MRSVTDSHPPNACSPTAVQNGHAENGSPQPHRWSWLMTREKIALSSPVLTQPGSAPSMRSSRVLPERPTPAMYSTFTTSPDVLVSRATALVADPRRTLGAMPDGEGFSSVGSPKSGIWTRRMRDGPTSEAASRRPRDRRRRPGDGRVRRGGGDHPAGAGTRALLDRRRRPPGRRPVAVLREADDGVRRDLGLPGRGGRPVRR